ncbi:MAG: hypothetical protein JNL57_01165 [Bacteroidetes bacterium]|nr:hypothetical protein [Bacteroidota bacterium]
MKRVLLSLFSVVCMDVLWGQKGNCPCSSIEMFDCNDSIEPLCGTRIKPLRMELQPVNCDSSMFDAHSIYCYVEINVPGKAAPTIEKIPSDRFAYFINKGSLPDSFTVALDSNLIQLVRKGSVWQTVVLKEAHYKSFHLDINTPELNAIIDRNGFGSITQLYRTPKSGKKN